MDCYPGPNPIKTDEQRMAIWKWAKENGIDQGMPLEKVHSAVNHYFFGNQAKPEWINDVLSGRKTPLREVANDAWKKQYNRRQAILAAKDFKEAGRSSTYTRLRKLWDLPRTAAVFGHGIVFPITHAGDLALRPQSWGVFFKGLFNTYTKAGSKAATERLLDSMSRQPLFDTALRSGLDVGPRALRTDLVAARSGLEKAPVIGKAVKWMRELSENAWAVLTTMRFELWNREVQKFIKPEMTQAEQLEIGKHMAEWANHATGSAKGPIANLGGNVLFGPKLTQSKLNRLVSDPIKTAQTFAKIANEHVKVFANWEHATPGEKAAATTRMAGSTQYLVSLLGFLGVNWGINWATGTKNKDNVNLTDPTKSDFLSFKGGGLEWKIPGLHSEIKFLGKILAVTFADSKAINKASRGKGKHAMLAQTLGEYSMGKFNPSIGAGIELASGQDFLGRPMPWSKDKGAPTKPPTGWAEYLLSHGPIPLQGPVRYVYDQLRASGSSATDATSIVKALILTGSDPTMAIKAGTILGVGATGVHISEDYHAAKDAKKRDSVAETLKAKPR